MGEVESKEYQDWDTNNHTEHKEKKSEAFETERRGEFIFWTTWRNIICNTVNLF